MTKGKKIGAERLLKLGKYLRDVVAKKHRRRFAMEIFSDGVFADKDNPSCGTRACALGWATNIFPELELELNMVKLKKGQKLFWQRDPYHYGLDAARVFFHLTQMQAEALFTANKHHHRAAEVADNILKFARKRLREEKQ